MPCSHRFQDRLLPTWPCDYLFVGTFNPIWVFPTKRRQATYFYGRTSNNYFWDLVPDLWGQGKMRKGEPERDWIPFLQKNRIGLTDIISNIEDADEKEPIHVARMKTMTDTDLVKFKQIKWHTDAIINFTNENRPKAIFFTTGSPPPDMETQIGKIEHNAKQLGIATARLITPSFNARYSLPGKGQLYNNIRNLWSSAISPLL